MEKKEVKHESFFFKKFNIEPEIFFLGSDEEIEAAENQEAARAAELEKVLLNNSMVYYTTSQGQKRYLHRSTRKGVAYQLSYEGSDGLPIMHENYIKTSDDHIDAAIGTKEDLIKHYIDQLYVDDLYLEVF